jgi:mannosyltransferase OCH1-like enzyme
MQYDGRRNKIEKNKKSLSRLNIPRVVLVVSLSCVCLLGAYIYEATITIPLNENFTETEFDRKITALQGDGHIVLHQTWKDTCVLETKVEHMRSWESIEDKIKVVFWTDETMDKWVEVRFEGTYIRDGWEILKNAANAHIKKADVFRALLVWYYGGIYADLDIQLRESFREFLEEKELVVAWEPREAMQRWSSYKAGDEKKTFMLSAFLLSGQRSSSFIAFFINRIIKKHIDNKSSKGQDVLFATGPAAEAEAYYAYIDQVRYHDSRIHVMTYREFSHYAEHHSTTTWIRETIKGIGCVNVTTVYNESTLIIGDPE